MSVGKFNFDQLVVLPQGDGGQTYLSHIGIFLQRRLLDQTLLGGHHKKCFLAVVFYRDHRSDLLSRHKLQEIDDGGSSGSPAGLRDLVAFQPVDPSGVGEEHNVVVGVAHQQILHIVFFQGLHSLDSLAAPVLGLEGVLGHPLDISKLGHGDHHVLPWDQVFHGNVVLVKSNGSAALVAIFFLDGKDLFLNHPKQKLTVRQDGFQMFDLFYQLVVFRFQLLPFQTGQRTQTHIHNGLGLGVA